MIRDPRVVVNFEKSRSGEGVNKLRKLCNKGRKRFFNYDFFPE